MSSKIEWTEECWNPTAGCTPISDGCRFCYAAPMTRRLEAMGQADYAGLTNKRHFNGQLRALPHKLDKPLKRRKPTMYFVNSMSDLFHVGVPDGFIDRVFAVMALCSQHTFQILTKRPERMAAYCPAGNRRNSLYEAMEEVADQFGIADFLYDDQWPLPNVWLGTSCEDQQRADERIPWLLKTPAAVRFISAEPLLSEVDLSRWLQFQGPGWRYADDADSSGRPGIDWVIVGGESGHGARACDVAWIRSIVEQCKAADAKCFVKQLGSRCVQALPDSLNWPLGARREIAAPWRMRLHHKKGSDLLEWPPDLRVRQFPRVGVR